MNWYGDTTASDVNLGAFDRISLKTGNTNRGSSYTSRAYVFEAKKSNNVYSKDGVQPKALMAFNIVRI